VRDAASEVEAAAIDFRELLARLSSDGLDFSLDLPILGKQTIHVELAGEESPETGE
jgi:hypothetical protein